jgi:class 3 adenylate cyclase
VVEGAFATRRWGLRFIDDEVESAYRRWFVDQAVPFTRIGMLVSSFGWLLAVLVPWVWLPGTVDRILPWVLGVIVPALALPVAASYLPRWRRMMLPLTAWANAAAGLVLVGPFLAGILEQPEATGAAVGLMLFAFAVFRLTLVQAVLAAGSYLLLDLVIVAAHLRSGELTTSEGVLHIALPVVLFLMAEEAHLLRSRVLRQTYRQERIIDQQHRLIARERDRADQLLLNILPRETAKRLKAGDRVIADSHDEVTVAFADIVGFTRIAQELSAERLVAHLDDLFSRFDLLADDLGVEKIRTIGDGYVAVGGLPTPRPDHATAVVGLAQGMLAAATRFRDEHGVDWQLRIGIHTGPVVAGVIGRRKFTYDLWGTTVNVASRLESTGQPGRIHVSEATLAHLGAVDHEPRGEVDLRNFGTIRTAFLDSVAAS